MADEQTHDTKPSTLHRLGTFLYDAARRVLGTAAERVKQRWSEVRHPAKRDTAEPTPASDVSQPAT